MIRDKEENQHAFTARFSKQDKPSLGKPSLGKPLGKLSKKPSSTNINKKDEIPTCTHYRYGKYRKCFYLYPKLRPEDWKLFKGKEYLTKEKLGQKKSNKASIESGDSYESTKSFMAKKSINTEIEHDVKE